jgi:hypothetical protein
VHVKPSSLLVLVLLAAACASPEPTITPMPTPDGPLLTISTRGGDCPNGPCGTTVFVERDGTVHVAAKPPNVLGVVPADQLAGLIQAIDTADYDEMRSHRFEGECPTNVDGQEFIFDFDTTTAVERIESCQVDIDWTSPLFVAIQIALGPYDVLPQLFTP